MVVLVPDLMTEEVRRLMVVLVAEVLVEVLVVIGAVVVEGRGVGLGAAAWVEVVVLGRGVDV